MAYLNLKGWSVKEIEQGVFKIISTNAKKNIQEWLLKKEDLSQQSSFLRFLARFEGLAFAELMEVLKKNLVEIKQEMDWKRELLEQRQVV